MTNTKNTAVIYDLDGTIIDSEMKIHADVERAIQRYNPQDRLSDTIWQERGRDWAYLGAYFGLTFNEINEGMRTPYRKSWERSISDGEVRLYDDARPSLDELESRQLTLATLTRSDPQMTREKLKGLDLERYFGKRVYVVDVDRKVHPNKRQGALDLLREIDRLVERVALIGDNEEDIEPAEYIADTLGIPTIGIQVIRSRLESPHEIEQTTHRRVANLAEANRIILGA